MPDRRKITKVAIKKLLDRSDEGQMPLFGVSDEPLRSSVFSEDSNECSRPEKKCDQEKE